MTFPYPVAGKAADERRRWCHVGVAPLAGIEACIGLAAEGACNISSNKPDFFFFFSGKISIWEFSDLDTIGVKSHAKLLN